MTGMTTTRSCRYDTCWAPKLDALLWTTYSRSQAVGVKVLRYVILDPR